MASAELVALTASIREQFGALLGGTVEEMRTGYDAVSAPLASDVTVQSVDAAGVPSEWVSTPNAGKTVVLYLHGGGYVIGSPNSHRELASRIARAAAARVLLINYRLAPENPFPAAVNDAVATYRFLLQQGVAPGNIAIAGDSAGGGLTLATLCSLRDAGDRLPAAAVTLSAWTDLAITGGTIKSKADVDPMVSGDAVNNMASTYLNGADAKHPLASPLYADLKGLPPLLMQVGTAETLLDDTLRVADRARAAGVAVTVEEYQDAFHVFQAFATQLPEGREAIEKIGGFVRAKAGAGVPA